MIKPMTVRVLFFTSLTVAAYGMVASPASAQDDAKVKQGEKVYTAQKCQVCHSIKNKGGKASPLDGVGGKLSADDIRHWIEDPTDAAAKAGSTKKPPMPAKYKTLAAGDIDALVAYMQSLK